MCEGSLHKWRNASITCGQGSICHFFSYMSYMSLFLVSQTVSTSKLGYCIPPFIATPGFPPPFINFLENDDPALAYTLMRLFLLTSVVQEWEWCQTYAPSIVSWSRNCTFNLILFSRPLICTGKSCGSRIKPRGTPDSILV